MIGPKGIAFAMSLLTHFFSVLLPFGDRLLKYLPDPFDFDKIGSVAANIIAERTKENSNSEAQVRNL